jgi:hypothetical protein
VRKTDPANRRVHGLDDAHDHLVVPCASRILIELWAAVLADLLRERLERSAALALISLPDGYDRLALAHRGVHLARRLRSKPPQRI